MTTLSNEADGFAEAARRLADLDDDDDAEDTSVRILSMTPSAAAEALRRAKSRSGEYRLMLPPKLSTDLD